MEHKIIAVFDAYDAASRARLDLLDHGFRPGEIDISEHQTRTEETKHADKGGYLAGLRNFFLGEDREFYEEAARRGGALLSVTADKDRLERAIEILQRHEPVDLEQRTAEWLRGGWKKVGKTWAETGAEQPEIRSGVRIYNRTETPAAEVHDLNKDFRRDFEERFAGQGYNYEDTQVAYRFGHDLSLDPRYRDRSWLEIEPEARQQFEARHPGLWEKLQDVVRSAFERKRERKAA